MPIFFCEKLSKAEVIAWRRVINVAYSSLSKEEKSVIPPFYVYCTMVSSLYHTFNAHLHMMEKMMDQFAQDKVWSYAFLQDPEIRNENIPEEEFQRIVIANHRTHLTPDLSPEMVVFHEMWHFILFSLHKIPYVVENRKQVEGMCDKNAIMSYVRMLIRNPQYSSNTEDGEVRLLEKRVRLWRSQMEEKDMPLAQIENNMLKGVGELLND